MKRILPSAVAISTGIIVLLGYVFDGGLLLGIRLTLTQWAVTLAGLAVLLGVINVIRNNARRIDQREAGWPYYIITLATLIATITFGIVEGLTNNGANLFMDESVSAMLVNGIIIPGQAVVAGLIVFALLFSAVRLIRDRQTVWTGIFIVAVFIALLGWVPLSGLGFVNQTHAWLLDVPVVAGARGILLGAALGTIIIGVRIILGSVRPYRD